MVGGVVILLLAGDGGQALRAQPANRGLKWYKGNTHTHTRNTDGDSSPDEVVRWYRDQRYNFVILTDHDTITNVDGLNAVFGAADAFNPFLVMKGEEVTDSFFDPKAHVEGMTGESDPGNKDAHVNAFNLQPATPRSRAPCGSA